MLSFDSGEMFARLHSAYYALEKIERMGLWFAVLPVCDNPTSERKRQTFIYDLSGRSVNDNVADLFPPVFSLESDELKIGI